MTATELFTVLGALLFLACAKPLVMCIKSWMVLGWYLLTTYRKDNQEITEIRREADELRKELVIMRSQAEKEQEIIDRYLKDCV